MARIAEESRGISALAIATGELRRGERLTWADYPGPMALVRRDARMSWIGIPFTAFAIFWTWSASHDVAHAGSIIELLFPLWGLMFVAIGLSILLRPVWSALKARSTVYAITDQRALIISGSRSRRVESFEPDSLGNLERTERSDGSGDIILRRAITMTSRSTFSYRRDFVAPAVGFFGVPEVRRVEDALGKLAASAKTN
jgi:hypothetical protein